MLNYLKTLNQIIAEASSFFQERKKNTTVEQIFDDSSDSEISTATEMLGETSNPLDNPKLNSIRWEDEVPDEDPDDVDLGEEYNISEDVKAAIRKDISKLNHPESFVGSLDDMSYSLKRSIEEKLLKESSTTFNKQDFVKL